MVKKPDTVNEVIAETIFSSISGRVLDAETERPIEGVWINVKKSLTYTDQDGRFFISFPSNAKALHGRSEIEKL